MNCGFGFDEPLHKVTEEQLASAINQALETTACAEEIRTRLTEDIDGEETAANVIDEFLSEQVLSGKWEHEFHQRTLASAGPAVPPDGHDFDYCDDDLRED